MASAASIAQSGMQAAQVRLDSAANNIANASTEGYQRERVVQQAQPHQSGVTARRERTAQMQTDLQAQLAEDIVEQMAAEKAYLANVAVFKSSNEMAGQLLDTHA